MHEPLWLERSSTLHTGKSLREAGCSLYSRENDRSGPKTSPKRRQAFLAALRDDWKPKIQTVKPPPGKKKKVPPEPEEPPPSDQERAKTSAQLKEFIETPRASR